MSIPLPHYNISYAQNFEDIFLAGVLKDVQAGFYVDVGANHPVQDSVTKIFYDKGWSGINVEPNSALHVELCKFRPLDLNLNIGLASQSGSLTFRSYHSLDGLSSFSHDAQENMRTCYPDAPYTDSHVEVSSLAHVLTMHRPTGDIHFLKIDVEGFELEVLLGNDWRRFRPWLLCIEQTLDAARRTAIEHFLQASAYSSVYFDGINDFYVANEKRAVWDGFSYAREMIIMNGVAVNHIFIKCIVDMTLEQQSLAKAGS